MSALLAASISAARVSDARGAPSTIGACSVPLVDRVDHTDLPLLVDLCGEHADHVGAGHPGCARDDTLELEEALFDPPVRLWAWIARLDGIPVGYVAASAGYALLKQGNRFRIESMYARPGPFCTDIEQTLFVEALRMARRLGCIDLQWRLPADQTDRLRDRLPRSVAETASIDYVLPLGAR